MATRRPGGPELRGCHLHERQLQRSFPAHPATARIARALTTSTCRIWQREGPCDILALAVSELVGNAIRHTSSSVVTIRLSMTRRRLRLEVGDGSRRPPQLRHADLFEEGGRGMWLVSELVARCGVTPLETGKVVWVEIPL